MPRIPYTNLVKWNQQKEKFIFSRRRGAVSFGEGTKQGDHSVAYALIVRSLSRNLNILRPTNDFSFRSDNKPCYLVYSYIVNMNQIARYFSDNVTFPDEFLNEALNLELRNFEGEILTKGDLSELLDESEIDKVTEIYRNKTEELEQMELDLKASNTIAGTVVLEKKLKDAEDTLIVELSTRYLRLRNKQLFVAFPSAGSLENDASEGSRIRIALEALDKLAKDAGQLMKYQAPDQLKHREPNSDDLDVSMSESDKSEFVLAYNNEEVSKLAAEQLLKVLWYPKMPYEKLIASSKKLKQRDNYLESLAYVIATCLLEFSLAYPEISHDETLMAVRDLVEDKISQEWELNTEQIIKLKCYINGSLAHSINPDSDSSQPSHSTSISSNTERAYAANNAVFSPNSAPVYRTGEMHFGFKSGSSHNQQVNNLIDQHFANDDMLHRLVHPRAIDEIVDSLFSKKDMRDSSAPEAPLPEAPNKSKIVPK